MSKLLKVFVGLVLAVITAALIYELILLARDMRRTEDDLAASVQESLTLADRTLADTDKAMIAVVGIQRDTTRTEAEMAGLLNQSRHAMLTAKQEKALVTGATKVLIDSDKAVLEVGTAAVRLGATAPTIDRTISGIGTDSHAVLAASRHSVESLDLDLRSTELHDTMTQIDASAANTSKATASAADALKETDEVVHKEAQQLFAPATKAEQAAHIIIRGIGWFLGY